MTQLAKIRDLRGRWWNYFSVERFIEV